MKIKRIYYYYFLIAILFFACKSENSRNHFTKRVSTKIDSIYTPNIGGIKQVVKIKTVDSEKPAILILSGGPGASSMNISESFTKILKSRFTLIEWDQRNVGKTLKLNSSSIVPSIELMSKDTYEVVRFITKELNKQKIHLLGSSWGNVLGFNTVKNHPELLHSYFAVNTVVNPLESERELLKTLKKHYKDDRIAAKELSNVTIPFEKDEDLFFLRKWMSYMDGMEYALSDNYKTDYFQWIKNWRIVCNQIMKINLPKTLKSVSCPIYFFVGENDNQTSTRITKEYFKELKAPIKELVVFKNSGQGIHNQEPVKFQNTIIELLTKDKLLN